MGLYEGVRTRGVWTRVLDKTIAARSILTVTLKTPGQSRLIYWPAAKASSLRREYAKMTTAAQKSSPRHKIP